MSKISNYIELSMMYRDADNYKSFDEVWLTNNRDLSDEDIQSKIQGLIDEQETIIPAYYGLPTISPSDNEFLTSNGPDHPYMSIEQIKFHLKGPGYEPDLDIFNVILAIDNPDIIEAHRNLAKQWAISGAQDLVKRLDGKIEKTKIWITMTDGNISSVASSSTDVEIIIANYDEEYGDEPLQWVGPDAPGSIFTAGEAYKEIAEDTKMEEELKFRQHLLDNKF